MADAAPPAGVAPQESQAIAPVETEVAPGDTHAAVPEASETVMPEEPDADKPCGEKVERKRLSSTRTCGLPLILLLATLLALQFGAFDSLLNLHAPKKKAPKWPYSIFLTREMVPVKRGNRTVSHKTSFTGHIRMGNPPQEFNMVFDTGSAHVLVPSVNCYSDSCHAHRRYNGSASSTSTRVNHDFEPVRDGFAGDRANIGFGTGSIVGSFVHERVCLGGIKTDGPCVNVGCLTATEMTDTPFLTSHFDGIFGLSFDALAISPYFSFFKMLALSDKNKEVALQFGIFLADVGSSQRSELTLGGYNADHLLTPLEGVPVTNREAGYWQVRVTGVSIGGVLQDMCLGESKCNAIVDTGTSHLGVPWEYHRSIMDQLSGEGVQDTDCRYIEGLPMEIMLDGIALALTPENYMRPLALPPDVKFGSMTGQYGAGIGGENDDKKKDEVAKGANNTAQEEEYVEPVYDPAVPWQCAPKVMPVKLDPELGKMFILGEPVLSRYYTVYDWGLGRISFGLNKRKQNKQALLEKKAKLTARSDEDGIVLSQMSSKVILNSEQKKAQAELVEPVPAPPKKKKKRSIYPTRKANKKKGEEDDDGFFLLRLPGTLV